MKLLKTLVVGAVLSLCVMNNAYADPLKSGTRIYFPKNIKTVGQAARYILKPVGYKLALEEPAPYESASIARQPISKNALSDNVFPIEIALVRLVGEDHKVIIDHEHKLVSFEAIQPLDIEVSDAY